MRVVMTMAFQFEDERRVTDRQVVIEFDETLLAGFRGADPPPTLENIADVICGKLGTIEGLIVT